MSSKKKVYFPLSVKKKKNTYLSKTEQVGQEMWLCWADFNGESGFFAILQMRHCMPAQLAATTQDNFYSHIIFLTVPKEQRAYHKPDDMT